MPDLLAALRAHPCAVLRAPTGAGKTTRVPPALLDAGLAGEGLILMLEPRRVAARAAARRMAEERGGTVGGEIGYHVRFERQASRATRILVVTEGIVVRMLQDDPFLAHVGVIVFDEFHERSLDTDLALAMARRVQRDARPDLKILAMSATVAAPALARWLGDAPIIESEGRLFPVDITYAGREDDRHVSVQVAEAVSRSLDKQSGDVLAFLPGVGEIRRAQEDLGNLCRKRDIALFGLYGDLPAEEQDQVLPKSERRKVVLATNVAETSITIDGVTAVVDSGLARVMRFDPGVGLDRLELERISRSSAEQRAGRAGRTAPGTCERLWTERVQRSLDEAMEPEIRRVDLAGAALQLLCFGESDVAEFPWFEPPSESALNAALSVLRKLGALDARGATDVGRAMVRLPVHPRLARLLVEGHARGVASSACLAAAMLQERDPFVRTQHKRARVTDSDVVDRVIALERFESHGSSASDVGQINAGAARFVTRAADALHRDLERILGQAAPRKTVPEEALMRALFAAYADRLAVRRGETDRRAVMTGGRGIRLGDESGVLDHELFVCVDMDAGRRGERAEAIVRQASAVEREWLDPNEVRTEVHVTFDREKERVAASKRTLYGDLILEEVQGGTPDEDQTAEVLAAAAANDLERALGLAEASTTTFLARAACLREWMPELELPAFDSAFITEHLVEFCRGSRSFADLKKRDLPALLRSKLTWAQQSALDREAPERLQVPSGSWIQLQYEPGRAPVLAARIQELFGLAETPLVAHGRVRVLMHLLAPNYRPQQVTDDLKSFWSNAYFEVRKDLKRRYPKHSWPEDPWNATPQRRPGRRS
ncbi:MAG: ATP-dependent helicase HrpB [Planctomycetes bacterium]|nr:ATP-dependent helicase HrpB [Planctomycetota bacterium]